MNLNPVIANPVPVEQNVRGGEPHGAAARLYMEQPPVRSVGRDVLDLSPQMADAIRASREGGDVLSVLMEGPGNERKAAWALITYMFQHTALGMDMPSLDYEAITPEAAPPAPLMEYAASVMNNLSLLDVMA